MRRVSPHPQNWIRAMTMTMTPWRESTLTTCPCTRRYDSRRCHGPKLNASSPAGSLCDTPTHCLGGLVPTSARFLYTPPHHDPLYRAFSLHSVLNPPIGKACLPAKPQCSSDNGSAVCTDTIIPVSMCPSGRLIAMGVWSTLSMGVLTCSALWV